MSFSIVALCIGGCGGAEPSGPGPLPPPSQDPPSAPSPTLAVLQGFASDRFGRTLSGVAIDITDGPLAGATTLTDMSGRFAFSEPTPLPVTVRLRRDGYAAKSESVRLKMPNYSFWLDELDLVNFEPGNYTLRLSLDLNEARSWPNLPQAPCAGIPTDALTAQFSATVKRNPISETFPFVWDHQVTVTGDGTGGGFYLAVGAHEASVQWIEIFKDLGNFRYLQIWGNEDATMGPISSSGSTVSISNPLDIIYCQLSLPMNPAYACGVPSSQVLDYHACHWDRAVMRFERK